MEAGVVAFAFGVPMDVLANRIIAKMAREEALLNHAAVFTQKDIDYPGAERALEEPGNPPPTLRIAREAAHWAKKNGFSELIVCAAEPHIWRCMRDLRKATEELKMSIVIREALSVRNYSRHAWFNKGSEQKRTASWFNWWPRETLLRCISFVSFKTYKRVAS